MPLALLLLATTLGATEPAGVVAPTEPFLRRWAETRGFQAGRPSRVALTPDGDAALFLRSPPRARESALYETDLATGRTRELASAASLAGAAAPAITNAAEQAQLERQRISGTGITGFRLSRDGARVLVTVGGKLFLLERRGGAARPLATSGRPLDARFSPDGARVSYVVDGDVRVLDLAGGAERRVTSGATATLTHGLAEFAAQEELSRHDGHWWSPDSKVLCYQETDESKVEPFVIQDPLHPERPADAFRYPRAGRENAAVRLGLVAASGGPTTWITWDRARWPYVASVSWEAGGPLSVVVLDRRQRSQALLAVDAATGATRLLVEETDAAWVNHVAGFPRWREDGSAFLWRTERDGGPALEWRAPGGAPLATWVRPDHGLGELVGWDEGRRWLWFTGGPNPAETRLWVVRDGAPPEEWGGGTAPVRVAATLARGGGALAVARTTFAGQGDWELFRPEGRRLASLPSVAEAPPFGVRGELRRVGPGEGLWTLLVRPRGVSPGVKLPVLVEVYGGPHAQQATVTADPFRQWIADQGFYLVRIDGRGTPRRGRAFERAIQGDFAGPALEDQVAGLQALAREVPELDLARAGIWGWSFGGYMAALAVLQRPDVFRAGVAGAPVTEWRDYDTAYTERYLGLPAEDPAAYDRSSLLPLAPRLTRPLLLIHGTADDNVYLLHSLKLADALLRAGRRHDLQVLPGLTHMALSTAEPALRARIMERLLGFLTEGMAAPDLPPPAPAP